MFETGLSRIRSVMYNQTRGSWRTVACRRSRASVRRANPVVTRRHSAGTRRCTARKLFASLSATALLALGVVSTAPAQQQADGPIAG
jgi:hypothetical protein